MRAIAQWEACSSRSWTTAMRSWAGRGTRSFVTPVPDPIRSTATEIPVGKPQVRLEGNQWVPRGHVLRCQILSTAAIPPDVDEPFISIDGRDFTLGEFMTMVGTFGGWGMRIEFVPDDELHQRPKLKVRDP